jgi:hypothetical protein
MVVVVVVVMAALPLAQQAIENRKDQIAHQMAPDAAARREVKALGCCCKSTWW